MREIEAAPEAGAGPPSGAESVAISDSLAARPSDETAASALEDRPAEAREALAQDTEANLSKAEEDAARVGAADERQGRAGADVAGAAVEAEEPVAEALRSRRAEGLTVTAADRDALLAGARWREADEVEAAAVLGRPPLRVPDLEVLAVEVADSGFVRLTQALADGVLEIVQWRAEGDDRLDSGSSPPAEEAAGPARQDVRTAIRNRVDGVAVTLRAALAPDSLRALASRIR